MIFYSLLLAEVIFLIIEINYLMNLIKCFDIYCVLCVIKKKVCIEYEKFSVD